MISPLIKFHKNVQRLCIYPCVMLKLVLNMVSPVKTFCKHSSIFQIILYVHNTYVDWYPLLEHWMLLNPLLERWTQKMWCADELPESAYTIMILTRLYVHQNKSLPCYNRPCTLCIVFMSLINGPIAKESM